VSEIKFIPNYNNILVLAPHTDDGELGCGGTISKLIENGSRVYYAAFSTAETSVPKGFPKGILKTEVKKATAALGIKADDLFVYNYEVRTLNYYRQGILDKLVQLRDDLNPDLVLMPSLHDIHQDHTTVAVEGLRAFKKTTILGYELIWNNLQFNAQCFIRLSQNNVQSKINALKEYGSQSGKDYMSEEFIFSIAKARGVQIGAKFAECFEVIRWVI
jgi:LmbE family N-acetylglucosaminyl deacetylase